MTRILVLEHSRRVLLTAAMLKLAAHRDFTTIVITDRLDGPLPTFHMQPLDHNPTPVHRRRNSKKRGHK